MKQLISSSPASVSSLAVQDPATQKRFPVLCEYLTTDAYEDGTPRQRSTLSMFSQDGSIKVCLNDKDANMSLFRTGAGFLEALGALEKDLARGDGLDWKPWNPKKRGK